MRPSLGRTVVRGTVIGRTGVPDSAEMAEQIVHQPVCIDICSCCGPEGKQATNILMLEAAIRWVLLGDMSCIQI